MKYLIKSINDFSDEKINDFAKSIKAPKRSKLDKLNIISYKQSVVGEILLSRLLKEEGIDYSNIIIKPSDSGKSFVVNYSIYYSISHDDEMVVCAINTLPIGVDIIKTNRMNKNIVNYFCNPNELEYFKNSIDYCKIFSLKEAYIKLLGLTISRIKDINVIKNGRISLSKKYFYDFLNYDNYIISICYEKGTL